MEPFKQRLLEEWRQLETRLSKAKDFMEGEKFKELDQTDRVLLHQQTLAMELYLSILKERINRIITPAEWVEEELKSDFTMGRDFWEKFTKHCDETGRTITLEELEAKNILGAIKKFNKEEEKREEQQ